MNPNYPNATGGTYTMYPTTTYLVPDPKVAEALLKIAESIDLLAQVLSVK